MSNIFRRHGEFTMLDESFDVKFKEIWKKEKGKKKGGGLCSLLQSSSESDDDQKIEPSNFYDKYRDLIKLL